MKQDGVQSHVANDCDGFDRQLDGGVGEQKEGGEEGSIREERERERRTGGRDRVMQGDAG